MRRVTINGVTHLLDDDEGKFIWVKLPPPCCPACGEPLSDGCDDESRQVPVHSEWHDEHYVECDCCETLYPIDDAPVKNREQADGWRGR